MADLIYTHHPLWRRGVEHRERVVVIEYWRGLRGRWIPSAVVTESMDEYRSSEHYDFEWCRNVADLYHHNSGGGGWNHTHVLCRHVKPTPPPRKLWVHPSVTLTHYVGRDLAQVPLTVAAARTLGYQIVPTPLDLSWLRPHGPATSNPFDVAEDSPESFVYCKRCRGVLRDHGNGDPCEHLTWCDECCDYVDCNHVPSDSSDGKPVVHKRGAEAESDGAA